MTKWPWSWLYLFNRSRLHHHVCEKLEGIQIFCEPFQGTPFWKAIPNARLKNQSEMPIVDGGPFLGVMVTPLKTNIHPGKLSWNHKESST